MGNLLDHLQKEKEMEVKNMSEQVKHDAYCMSRFEKLALLEDIYGKEELLYAFLEYLDDGKTAILDDILDNIIETALAQGDIE